MLDKDEMNNEKLFDENGEEISFEDDEDEDNDV